MSQWDGTSALDDSPSPSRQQNSHSVNKSRICSVLPRHKIYRHPSTHLRSCRDPGKSLLKLVLPICNKTALKNFYFTFFPKKKPSKYAIQKFLLTLFVENCIPSINWNIIAKQVRYDENLSFPDNSPGQDRRKLQYLKGGKMGEKKHLPSVNNEKACGKCFGP